MAQTSSPPGRPRKPAAERRSSTFAIRFRRDELLRLDLLASGSDMSLSEYIRVSALGARPEGGLSAEAKHYLYRLLLMLESALAHDPAVFVLTAKIRVALGGMK